MNSMRIRLLVLLFLLFHLNSAQKIVKTLPGYPGILPFKLETGYVGVGENEELQLFYYFVESEENPDRDPLLLWFTGGPGCSALAAFLYEIGPLTFNYEAFDGSLPSVLLNPYAWTKIANIIFLDLPVGAGFSYSTTSEGYYSSDTEATKNACMFLQKWLLNHPNFIKNSLYIGGDSYSGKIVPVIVKEILTGNEAGLSPFMSVQGYVIGNPVMHPVRDINFRVPYAHRMGLISDEYYKLAKSSCHGEYINPDPENFKCLLALQLVKQCTNSIYPDNILEPKCKYRAPKPDGLIRDETYGVVEESIDILLPSNQERPWCRDDNYALSPVWANDPTVREALGVRNGTKPEWRKCNKTLSYDHDVESAFHYHQVLSRNGLQALVYSGDHDMMIPHIGTLAWIKDLNLTLDEDWRPWFKNGQVAGYTMRYSYGGNRFFLTFATVKGAGHTAPEFKPKECLAMIERWFSYYPL